MTTSAAGSDPSSRPQAGGLPVLVTGATGTQGGAVIRAIVGAGLPAAALVRDPGSGRARALADLGVELRTGDLADEASLVRAFADVSALYAVTTPFEGGTEQEVAQGVAVVDAAVAAGVPWLVLASVAAADRAAVPHFRSKARIEEHLGASGVPWTVVAPSYFYENVSRPDPADPVLRVPLPATTPLHQVALEDLGAVVAAVLGRRDEHLGVRVEVAGDAPTPQEMADALGVTFEEQPLEAVEARSADLGAMYRFLAGPGYGIDVDAVRARYPEVAWRSFSAWARG
ncbi:NmrA family NAD(P)-binding protein [Patulibacter minatonensis]|uniref:NmrA family NAD(P)-binding protein n=1 Tax=Patulibacter minatonensis TaxID=298163 RepID=UPI0004B4518A|nr:NmrA family NAD(P)-binding protein [Patulibacter minatonensis]